MDISQPAHPIQRRDPIWIKKEHMSAHKELITMEICISFNNFNKQTVLLLLLLLLLLFLFHQQYIYIHTYEYHFNQNL